MMKMTDIWRMVAQVNAGMFLVILSVGILWSACFFFYKVWQHINTPVVAMTRFVMPNDLPNTISFNRALSEKEVQAITAWYKQDKNILHANIENKIPGGVLICGGDIIVPDYLVNDLLKYKDFKVNFVKPKEK